MEKGQEEEGKGRRKRSRRWRRGRSSSYIPDPVQGYLAGGEGDGHVTPPGAPPGQVGGSTSA